VIVDEEAPVETIEPIDEPLDETIVNSDQFEEPAASSEDLNDQTAEQLPD